MNDEACGLEVVKLFAPLSEEDRRAVEGLASVREFAAGDVIYAEGTPGSSMFAVLEGAVELQAKMGDRESHPLITVREGSVFGLLEVIEPQARNVTARALSPARALEISRGTLEGYLKENAESGLKILSALAVGCARQLKIVVNLLRENLAWSLEVSGAGALALSQLISNSAEIQLELTGGHSLDGVLLKVDKGEAGHQLFIRDADHRVHLVPYHSVVSLSFQSEGMDEAKNLAPDL